MDKIQKIVPKKPSRMKKLERVIRKIVPKIEREAAEYIEENKEELIEKVKQLGHQMLDPENEKRKGESNIVNQEITVGYPIESLPTVDGWKIVGSWHGKGKKNTENFKIATSNWRLRWSTQPGPEGEGPFKIFVCSKEDLPIDEAGNVSGCDENSSYMKKAGEFYLKIDSVQPYYIVAEECTTVSV